MFLENSYQSPVVLVAAVTLCGTFINSLVSMFLGFLRHRETMRVISNVERNVNGKMERLLTVTGDAREAIGMLRGGVVSQQGGVESVHTAINVLANTTLPTAREAIERMKNDSEKELNGD